MYRNGHYLAQRARQLRTDSMASSSPPAKLYVARAKERNPAVKWRGSGHLAFR